MSQTQYAAPRLGNCTKCHEPLAVRQLAQYRLQNDHKIFLDEEGKDVPLDVEGNPRGKVAMRWTVACLDCGLPHLDHPYQKELDALAAKQKAAVVTAPAPAFTDTSRFMSAGEVEERNRATLSIASDTERRVAALEAALGRIEQLLTREKGA